MSMNFISNLNPTSPTALYPADIATNKNLYHEERDASLQAAIDSLIDKVKKRHHLPYVTVERQLELIDLLADCGLGRFLLAQGGLNGWWTNYVIKHPSTGRLTGLNEENKPLNEIEDFLLNQAPTSLATQKRALIFKEEIQKRVRDRASLASIPCGMMTDLLDLDFTETPHISLTGIDLDPESLAYAKQYAEILQLADRCNFRENNAWALDIHEEFDLITSNGLAVYEHDDAKVTELYRGFFEALKPGGYLVTSYLSPPPAPGLKTEWNVEAVNMQDALLQKIIFSDILDCKWQAFRSEEVVKSQLQMAGFEDMEIIYDTAHIFPTIVGRKPLKNC